MTCRQIIIGWIHLKFDQSYTKLLAWWGEWLFHGLHWCSMRIIVFIIGSLLLSFTVVAQTCNIYGVSKATFTLQVKQNQMWFVLSTFNSHQIFFLRQSEQLLICAGGGTLTEGFKTLSWHPEMVDELCVGEALHITSQPQTVVPTLEPNIPLSGGGSRNSMKAHC